MTYANGFKIALIFFVLFWVLTQFIHFPTPVPFLVGLLLGTILANTGLIAWEERQDRLRNERWERMWR